jgi:hypothetical protein
MRQAVRQQGGSLPACSKTCPKWFGLDTEDWTMTPTRSRPSRGEGGGCVDEKCWQAIGKLWYPWVFQKACPGPYGSGSEMIDALPEILRDAESILVPITDRSDSSGSSRGCRIGVTLYAQKSQSKKKMDNETTIVNYGVRQANLAGPD